MVDAVVMVARGVKEHVHLRLPDDTRQVACDTDGAGNILLSCDELCAIWHYLVVLFYTLFYILFGIPYDRNGVGRWLQVR